MEPSRITRSKPVKQNSMPSRAGQLQRHCAAYSRQEFRQPPSSIYNVLRMPGHPLDLTTRSFMERGFQHDFSKVRVHTDMLAEKSAQQVNALAYTVGNHLVFAPGQYRLGTTKGQHLLAHELAHTIQQSNITSMQQSGLHISNANDPAESEANAAADAVICGTSALPALTPIPISLNRQERATPSVGPRRLELFPLSIYETVPQPRNYQITRVETTDKEDIKRVYLDNGQRYRITRHRWISRQPGSGRSPFARLQPGIDRQRIWMEIEWCTNRTEGRFRAGANVPEQAIRLIINSVTSRGNIDQAISQLRFTPYSEAELRVGRWRLSLRGETTVDTEGRVTGAGGRVGVETHIPGGRIGVFGGIRNQRIGENPLGGLQGGINITYTLGTSSTEPPGCKPQKEILVENYRYECQLERDIPAHQVQRSRRVPRHETTTRYIYFDYALPRINHRLSNANLAALTDDLRNGFRVSSIRGFTSPEGPMEPGRRFEGNIELSRQRAATALAEVQAICRREVGENQTCTRGNVSPSGLGELYTLTKLTPEGTMQEIEGPAQAKYATERFLAEEKEAPHRTKEIIRQLKHMRTSQERTELVYERLRRAAIILERTRTVTESYAEEIPARVETIDVLGGCPAEIINRAFPEAERRK